MDNQTLPEGVGEAPVQAALRRLVIPLAIGVAVFMAFLPVLWAG